MGKPDGGKYAFVCMFVCGWFVVFVLTGFAEFHIFWGVVKSRFHSSKGGRSQGPRGVSSLVNTYRFSTDVHKDRALVITERIEFRFIKEQCYGGLALIYSD